MTAALWTLYVVAVGALYVTCWRQASKFDRAQRQLEAMRERQRQEEARR